MLAPLLWGLQEASQGHGPDSWDQQMLVFMEEIVFGKNSFQGTVANV